MKELVESELIDGISVRYLQYLGQWRVLNEYRTTGRWHLYLTAQIVLTVSLCFPFFCFQLFSPNYIKIDLEKATILTLNSLSCVQTSTKLFVFLANVKVHSRLFDVIRRDLLTCIPRHKQAKASEIYKKITSWSNFFCFVANATNIAAVVTWISVPGIRSEYIAFHVGNMKEVNTGPVKILGGWYPVPFTTSPWAEIVYYYEAVLLFWMGIIVSLYECILTQLVMSLYSHFEVLSYHVSTLTSDDVSVEQGDRKQFLYDQYVAIIKDHQRLFRYGTEMKDSYNLLITVLLGTGALILIISIFQFLFGNKDMDLMIKFMLYLAFEFVEFVLLCFSTTFLETASTDIQFAIYESQWYKGNKRLRNTAQLIMLRARRPVSMIAVKMYPVNVQTLMSVLQFTYSVPALMSRMLQKQ